MRRLAPWWLGALALLATDATATQRDIDVGDGIGHLLVQIHGAVVEPHLISPVGQRVEPGGDGFGVEWYVGADFVEVAIERPVPGRWRLVFGGSGRVDVIQDLELVLDFHDDGVDGEFRAASKLRRSMLGDFETSATLYRSDGSERYLRVVPTGELTFHVPYDGEVLGDGDYVLVGAWGFAYASARRFPPAPPPAPPPPPAYPLVGVDIPASALPRRVTPPPPSGEPGLDPLAPLVPAWIHYLWAGIADFLFVLGVTIVLLRPRRQGEDDFAPFEEAAAAFRRARDAAIERGIPVPAG